MKTINSEENIGKIDRDFGTHHNDGSDYKNRSDVTTRVGFPEMLYQNTVLLYPPDAEFNICGLLYGQKI
jgi:hypothetical protein